MSGRHSLMSGSAVAQIRWQRGHHQARRAASQEIHNELGEAFEIQPEVDSAQERNRASWERLLWRGVADGRTRQTAPSKFSQSRQVLFTKIGRSGRRATLPGKIIQTMQERDQ